MGKYIISIDQSTQGTKALLFDSNGRLVHRADLAHEQIIGKEGWVSHNPEELYRNTLQTVKNLVVGSKIEKNDIMGIGICNQRETTVVWDKTSGAPLANAIVWQCARAGEICRRVESMGKSELIRQKTGINLSPYFPASKMAWILENVDGARKLAEQGNLCLGTVDTWLIFKLTKGHSYKTDYSNASRTQLFNIRELKWDEEICHIFGLQSQWLAEVCDSDSLFGETDFDGFLEHPMPIHGVLGDSHGALFAQGCLSSGMVKATYGTGSSVMMNIGGAPVLSTHGLVTSLAWGMSGQVDYVLEGNINYTGAVITWLKNDMEMFHSLHELEPLLRKANPDDKVYLVPAFTGFGAPYWDSGATAALTGMTRTTGKAEVVRAGLECIAYQIADIVKAMGQDSGITIADLRVDGGAANNAYLMQFQSNILNIPVLIPQDEELSGIGAAYAAGMGIGVYDNTVFQGTAKQRYIPNMTEEMRQRKYSGWLDAVHKTLGVPPPTPPQGDSSP